MRIQPSLRDSFFISWKHNVLFSMYVCINGDIIVTRVRVTRALKTLSSIFNIYTFLMCLHFSLQDAKKAYESVMAIGPRRPVTAEFLEFEKHAMERATDVYGYVWQTGAEVRNVCVFVAFMKLYS